MKSKSFARGVAIWLVALLVFGLSACGEGGSVTTDSSTADTSAQSPAESSSEPSEQEPVTIKFFSNVPDRTQGLGLLEQTNLDNYVKAHPNVKIEQEQLQDEPYKQKFQAYMASGDMPDIWQAWGSASFLGPAVKGGLVAELNPEDYESYRFLPGATDGFTFDGKLYGLPKNCDYWVLYYNKEIFDKNGVKVPETFDDLLTAAEAFRAKGINPCAINGKDKWPLIITYQTLVTRVSGDQKLIYNTSNGTTTFAKEKDLLTAANLFKQLVDARFYQDSFTVADYGTARNLFVQGKAAMYNMGSWEMGMGNDKSIPDDIRNNIKAIKFPVVADGKGSADDLTIWFGGGYCAYANSKVKAQAIELLNEMMKPENYAKNAWQQGACVPPMKYDQFFTGSENQVQKDLTDILNNAKSASGTTFNDSLTPSFKTDSETVAQNFAAGALTPEEFLAEMDKAIAKVKK